MILPTPEFDPLFADDGISFRTKMLGYIEQEFSDILGDRRRILNSNAGLDWLAQQISRELSQLRPTAAPFGRVSCGPSSFAHLQFDSVIPIPLGRSPAMCGRIG